MTKRTADAIEKETEQCSVCLELLGSSKVELECGHVYCDDCPKEWVKRSNTCPQCRAPITELRYKRRKTTVCVPVEDPTEAEARRMHTDFHRVLHQGITSDVPLTREAERILREAGPEEHTPVEILAAAMILRNEMRAFAVQYLGDDDSDEEEDEGETAYQSGMALTLLSAVLMSHERNF